MLLLLLSYDGALERALGGRPFMANAVALFCIFVSVDIGSQFVPSKSTGYLLLEALGCFSLTSSTIGPRTLPYDTVFEYIELFMAILEDSRKRTICSFWHNS